MKGLLIALVLVLLCAFVGWVSFSNSDSTATIQIDKQEVKEDAQEAAHTAKEAAEKVVTETQEAFGEAEDELEEVQIDEREEPVPQTTP